MIEILACVTSECVDGSSQPGDLLCGVGCGKNTILAGDVSDPNSGWRQSTQNGTLLDPHGGIGAKNKPDRHWQSHALLQ